MLESNVHALFADLIILNLVHLLCLFKDLVLITGECGVKISVCIIRSRRNEKFSLVN